MARPVTAVFDQWAGHWVIHASGHAETLSVQQDELSCFDVFTSFLHQLHMIQLLHL